MPVLKSVVLPVCLDACRKPVRSADPLKVRCDFPVIQGGVIAAVAADEFAGTGVTAFRAAFHQVDRLTSQDQCPAQRGLIVGMHHCLLVPDLRRYSRTRDWCGLLRRAVSVTVQGGLEFLLVLLG